MADLDRAPAPHRHAEIDAIRGIIILLVLASSFVTVYQTAIGHTQSVSAIPAVGFLALQWFLAASGYRMLVELEEVGSAGSYLCSRSLRYLPALWPAAIAAGLLLHMPGLLPLPAVSWRALPANLVMVPDIVGIPVMSAPFWRLKIELMMSVSLGVLWFALQRRIPAMLVLGTLGIEALIATGAEPVHQHLLSLPGALTLDMYLPPCAFGIAVFHLRRCPRDVGWWAVAIASVLLLPLIGGPVRALVVLVALCVFGAAACGRVSLLGRCRGLMWLGQLSYPIYVVHQVPGFVIIHWLEAHGIAAPLAILGACGCAVGLGGILHYAVELPARNTVPGLLAGLAGRLQRQAPAAQVPC